MNLAAGYDYNALIRATKEGAAAYDPRYGMDDFFNPRLQGQFSVKFIFSFEDHNSEGRVLLCRPALRPVWRETQFRDLPLSFVVRALRLLSA